MRLEIQAVIAQPQRNDYAPAIIHAAKETFANAEALIGWLQTHNRQGSTVTIAEVVYLD